VSHAALPKDIPAAFRSHAPDDELVLLEPAGVVGEVSVWFEGSGPGPPLAGDAVHARTRTGATDRAAAAVRRERRRIGCDEKHATCLGARARPAPISCNFTAVAYTHRLDRARIMEGR
jgi:hypothetical protein